MNDLFDNLLIHTIKTPDITATALADTILEVDPEADPRAALSLANKILLLARESRKRVARTNQIIADAAAGYPSNSYTTPIIIDAAHHTNGQSAYWTQGAHA